MSCSSDEFEDLDTFYSDDSDGEGPDFQDDEEPLEAEQIHPGKGAEKKVDIEISNGMDINMDCLPKTYRPTFYAPDDRPSPAKYSTKKKDGTDLPHPDVGWKKPKKVDGAEKTGGISDNRMHNFVPEFPNQLVAPRNAPNILLVMTDDVGFGAASTFGGPADTPTMSRLADEGLIYNGFHTTAICSATRAALLTGRQPHNVSTGFVTDSATGFPGYYSQFPQSCATIGQILKLNGYSTAWFGKNHNTPPWETSASGPFDQWPTGLGFERFYGFMGGEADQYHPLLYDDTVPIQPSLGKKDYHLDTDLKDKCIDFIKSRTALTPDKPWFAFYAPGATHAPHHVTKEFTDKYVGKAKMKGGWDKMRERTLMMQKRLKLVPESTKCSVRPPEIGSWEKAIENDPRDEALYTRMLEVYCAFLEMTDANIGKIVDTLDDLDIADNTMVIYIQGDNGGSAEGTETGSTNELAAMLNNVPEPTEFRRDSKDELGRANHFNHMPVGWAWALNSPMQWAKRFASHFGGTRNGMVVRWPKVIPAGEPYDVFCPTERKNLRTQFLHVVDIVPTILEAAGVQTPINNLNGVKQKKFDGKSFIYTFDQGNNGKNKHKEMVFEMGGTFGYYEKGWMLSSTPKLFPWLPEVKESDNPDYYKEINWELYNLKHDFSQAYNLVHKGHLAKISGKKKDKYEKRRDQMIKQFTKLAEENNIFPYCANGPDRRAGMKGKPSIADGYGVYKYRGKITRIPEACAPKCKNVSFKIVAVVDFDETKLEGKLPHGCIYAMGGRYCGFALYVWNGQTKLVYKKAHWPDAIYTLAGKMTKESDKLRMGRNKIIFDFDYVNKNVTGGPADLALIINGHVQEELHLDTTVSKFYSVTECLDIGEATGTAVADEYTNEMPFALNGAIESVDFIVEDTLPEDKKAEVEMAEIQYEQTL